MGWMGDDFEGASFEGEDMHGWQILPYSSLKKEPCAVHEADSILVRAALISPKDGAGHISAYEARRMSVALERLADAIEAMEFMTPEYVEQKLDEMFRRLGLPPRELRKDQKQDEE